MPITEKNHYNPCFWTAYWNPEYLAARRKEENVQRKAREQEIYSLNLKSNKILRIKTANAFYDKGAGLSSVTKDNFLDYVNRAYPEEYDSVKEYYDEHPNDLILDFENHFSEFEKLYKPSLEKTIITKLINTIEDKTFLSFFVFTQIIRNHNDLNQAIAIFKANNMAKFEAFLDIRHTIANPDRMMNLLSPFVFSNWILYRNKQHSFPLSDNPVLIRPLHIYLPFAPDLLLEINLKQKVSVNNICNHKNSITSSNYYEYKKRTIENSSREIVFGTKDKLERWQYSHIYKRHLYTIKRLLENNKNNNGK